MPSAAGLEESARRAGASPEALQASLPDIVSEFSLDEELDANRRKQLLSEVLFALPEELRLVLVLQTIEGLSKREVAEALQIPEGTVASRVRRARELFRAALVRKLGANDAA